MKFKFPSHPILTTLVILTLTVIITAEVDVDTVDIDTLDNLTPLTSNNQTRDRRDTHRGHFYSKRCRCLDSSECEKFESCCNGYCCHGACLCNLCNINTCCPVGHVCGFQCCDPVTSTCCNGQCCPRFSSTCCNGVCCPHATSVCCNGVCCHTQDSQAIQQCCNDNICCPLSWTCDERQGQCCPRGERPCRGNCCTGGDTCVAGGCCPSSRECGSFCCGTDEYCVGTPFDSRYPFKCCGGKDRNCGGKSCCPQQNSCCGDNTFCCDVGTQCCGHVCCSECDPKNPLKCSSK